MQKVQFASFAAVSLAAARPVASHLLLRARPLPVLLDAIVPARDHGGASAEKDLALFRAG